MNKKFDQDTQRLLVPNTGDTQLSFNTLGTSAIHPATATDTLLVSEGSGGSDVFSKYKNTINTTAYEPINPFAENVSCPECKRKRVRFQRLGEQKTAVYVCICGHVWY